MEEKTPNHFSPAISFQWRLLAAICLVTSALVVFAFFGSADNLRFVYTEWYGDMPLPQLTMIFFSYGFWMKWVTGIALLGVGVWILISQKTLPFFFAAIAFIFSNLLLTSMVISIFMPLLTTTFKMGI